MAKNDRNLEQITLAVVVRYDGYDSDEPQHRITLKEAFRSFEEADAEAKRLNKLKHADNRLYFVAPVRYFPEGRGVLAKY